MNKGAVTSVVLSLFAPLAAFAQDTENVNVLDANSAPIATLLVPRRGIQPSEIAVLINDNDPQSVDVANYYQNKRNIPNQNMIHLNFDQNKLYPGFMINSGIDPTDKQREPLAAAGTFQTRTGTGGTHVVYLHARPQPHPC
jgi:hypothetical protein